MLRLAGLGVDERDAPFHVLEAAGDVRRAAEDRVERLQPDDALLLRRLPELLGVADRVDAVERRLLVAVEHRDRLLRELVHVDRPPPARARHPGRGERVTCVYHSHVEAGAYFSEMDQDFAGQPLFPFPDADHLVVSVVGAKIVDQAIFRRAAAGFVGHVVAYEPR